MTKLIGIILVASAIYWFCTYWPNTVSNGAMVTAQTQITRSLNK